MVERQSFLRFLARWQCLLAAGRAHSRVLCVVAAGGMASAPLMGSYLDSDVWSFPSLLGIPLDKLNVRAPAPCTES